jgi:hypothetical protein
MEDDVNMKSTIVGTHRVNMVEHASVWRTSLNVNVHQDLLVRNLPRGQLYKIGNNCLILIHFR